MLGAMGAASTPGADCAVYTPKPRVLARRLLGVGLLLLGWFVGSVLVRVHQADWPYFRDVFPVHLLLAGMVALYLVFLSQALFRSLAADYVIRRTPAGLRIEGEGNVWDLHWEHIRQVRFGDLYLKLETVQGHIEVPFIGREEQCEIFRCHLRAVGLRPDPGRFFAPRTR